ncbi:MAG: 5'-3' exonuclease [Nocardioidaceae bacterium]
MTSRLMLLDTASLYFRAFFGIPDTMHAPDGTPVNAVRGLLDFIARLVTAYEPTELVCCWDDDWRPQWRVDLIPTYKAHRVVRVVADGVDVEVTPDPLVVQIPIIRAVLDALHIAVIGAPQCEADDVIGTLAARATQPVDIVTGDRDLFQLVSDSRQVRVLYTARGVGRLEVVTDSVVVQKYGVLPEQYADFAVMRGDPSDGLPGVKGVGDKTAASLLQSYGDLAGVVTAAADPGSTLSSGVRAKLLASTDYLAVAPVVVEVARAADLPDADPRLPDLTPDQIAEAEALSKRYELGSSMTRAIEAISTHG